jgi:hypothetical protein
MFKYDDYFAVSLLFWLMPNIDFRSYRKYVDLKSTDYVSLKRRCFGQQYGRSSEVSAIISPATISLFPNRHSIDIDYRYI